MPALRPIGAIDPSSPIDNHPVLAMATGRCPRSSSPTMAMSSRSVVARAQLRGTGREFSTGPRSSPSLSKSRRRRPPISMSCGRLWLGRTAADGECRWLCRWRAAADKGSCAAVFLRLPGTIDGLLTAPLSALPFAAFVSCPRVWAGTKRMERETRCKRQNCKC